MKQSLLGIGLRATAGTGVATLYPGTILYGKETTAERPVETNNSAAEDLAATFATRLEDLERLAIAGSLDSSAMMAMRDEIAHRFGEAFAAITELEEEGNLIQASIARAIMHNAINYHKEESVVGSMVIVHDLEIFTGLMNETLLERTTV